MKHEIHVTLDYNERTRRSEDWLNKLAADHGWKTSRIMDDPILGPGARFYFTAYANTLMSAMKKIEKLCGILDAHLLYDLVRREKVEAILYDRVLRK